MLDRSGQVMTNRLNKDYLKDRFLYLPDSGDLIYRDSHGSRVKKGDKAGYLNKFGYLVVKIGKSPVHVHRIAWIIHHGFTPECIDHINGVRNDNRIKNLRSVDVRSNAKNSSKKRSNKSGVCGVHYCNIRKKWVPQIRGFDGRKVYLGRYDDFFEAVCARKSAERRYEYHQNHGKDLLYL